MSDDLIARLRPKSDTGRPLGNLLHEAADEIEALRAVVRVACAGRWVDFTEDGIRWAGFVPEDGDAEWVGEAEADAVRRALSDDTKETTT